MAEKATTWTDSATVDLKEMRVTLSEPVPVGRRRGYFWFPNLWTMPNGDLLSTISPVPDIHLSGVPYLVLWSQDGGLTWSEPRVSCDGGQTLLHLHAGDSILLPYCLRPRPQGIGAPHNLLPAGQRVFDYVPSGVVIEGMPAPIPPIVPGLDVTTFSFNGQTLGLEDGAYLATVYGKFEGDERIMCVFRVESRLPFGQTWSGDEGRSWTPAAAMPGIFSVQPSLAVMADGMVALSGGRPGLYLWLNADGDGRDWRRIDILAHHNSCHPDEPITYSEDLSRQQTTSYTEVVAVDENTLLYMYDRAPNGWRRIPEEMDDTNSVWLARVTVER